MATTSFLGLWLPLDGEPVVTGEVAGVPKETLNLQAIDAAMSSLNDSTPLTPGITAYAASAAITQKFGTLVLTDSSAAAMTLADPTTGTDDGKILRIVSKTAHAHKVTAAGGFAGGTNLVATFGGAIGDTLEVEAISGKWYPRPSINITYSAS